MRPRLLFPSRRSLDPLPPANAGGGAVEFEVVSPAGFNAARPWGQRLWHLLWVVPLLAVGVHLATPPDRTGGAPRILAFAVEPAAARPGAAVTLNWSVEGAEEVRIDPAPGRTLPAVGRQTLPAPQTTTVFRLTASAFGLTRSATVQLEVAQASPEILLFEAQPKEIRLGESALLTWTVAGDDVVVTIEPGDGSHLGAHGSVVLNPTVSTVYTLHARNAVGQNVARAEVLVGGRSLPGPPEIRRFEVVGVRDGPSSPVAGEAGATVVLGWSVSGAERIDLEGGESYGDLAAEGEIEVPAPEWATIYYLTARGANGTTMAELEVPGTSPEANPTPPTPPVVVQADPGSAGDGGTAAVPGGDAFARFAPVVESFEVTPTRARLGDEVVVRWSVTGADAVSVRLDPTVPGIAPAVAANGISRFIATGNATVVLEATNVAGTVVRRQVALTVQPFAAEAIGRDVAGGGPRLLVPGEAGTGTALVTEQGSTWIFQGGTWRYAGALPGLAGTPVSAGFVGQTLFIAGADGRLWALDVSGIASPSDRLDPWRSTLAVGGVELDEVCAGVVGIAGFSAVDDRSGADLGGTLIVACAKTSSEPPRLLALSVAPGGAVDMVPRWSHPLRGTPAALAATPRPGTGDGVIALRYAADDRPLRRDRSTVGGSAALVDLFTASTGWIGMVRAPGRLGAVAPSPDGNVVAATVAGDSALWVLDRRGVAARRIELPAAVASLTWQSVLDAGSAGGETPRYSSLSPGATPIPAAAPIPPADGTPPPLAPATDEADALAIGASPGWVLVTWYGQPGGAIVSLAPRATAPVVAQFLPDRELIALVDDGAAVVGAARTPSRVSAFPWLGSEAVARRDADGGGP